MPSNQHQEAQSPDNKQLGEGSSYLQRSPPFPDPGAKEDSRYPRPEALTAECSRLSLVGSVGGGEGMVPYTQGSHTRAWHVCYPEVPSICSSLLSLYSQLQKAHRPFPASCLEFLTSSPTLSPQQPDVAGQQSSQLALISWGGGHWGHVIPWAILAPSALFLWVIWFPSCLWTLQALSHPSSFVD